MDILTAKSILDKHIKKQRTHMYKPIQIAEILYTIRTKPELQIIPENLDTYRTASREWRNIVTRRLVGRISTSSAKYQDDIFNAISPEVIKTLSIANLDKSSEGVVESYIYHNFKNKLANVYTVSEFLKNSTTETFKFQDFLDLFDSMDGLKKSIDKIYEITVYSLFYTIIKYLDVKVEMSINNPDSDFIKDFSDFTSLVLGIDETNIKSHTKATIFRVGATNAADKGLDMWSNFGPAIQVKHLKLTEELTNEITSSISADDIIIVCTKTEENLIRNIFTQLGDNILNQRIKGIVTEENLVDWYNRCFESYKTTVAQDLLNCFRNEFKAEFPSSSEIIPFLEDRGYNENQLIGDWEINN